MEPIVETPIGHVLQSFSGAVLRLLPFGFTHSTPHRPAPPTGRARRPARRAGCKEAVGGPRDDAPTSRASRTHFPQSPCISTPRSQGVRPCPAPPPPSGRVRSRRRRTRPEGGRGHGTGVTARRAGRRRPPSPSRPTRSSGARRPARAAPARHRAGTGLTPGYAGRRRGRERRRHPLPESPRGEVLRVRPNETAGPYGRLAFPGIPPR